MTEITKIQLDQNIAGVNYTYIFMYFIAAGFKAEMPESPSRNYLYVL